MIQIYLNKHIVFYIAKILLTQIKQKTLFAVYFNDLKLIIKPDGKLNTLLENFSFDRSFIIL